MTNAITLSISMAVSFFASLFGPWNSFLQTLIIIMTLDFITGIITAILGKSPKSKSGYVSSKSIYKGLLRKFLILIIVIITHFLGDLIGKQYFRDIVCIAYIINDTVSIIENVSLCGLPIPNVIKQILDVLKGGNTK